MAQRRVIPTTYAEKVSGSSFEEIMNLITPMRTEYFIRKHPHVGETMFRSSEIYVLPEVILGLEESFGKALRSKVYDHLYTYEAEYEMKPGFNIKDLSGCFSLREGRLVEKTALFESTAEEIIRNRRRYGQ